eukprot:1019185-Rhodomonas_salina.1
MSSLRGPLAARVDSARQSCALVVACTVAVLSQIAGVGAYTLAVLVLSVAGYATAVLYWY